MLARTGSHQRTKKSKKQPYFICLKNNTLLAFAGIWEDSISTGGEKIRTCAILTTAANPFMLKIHNRMPLILSKNNFYMWLNSSDISLKDINTHTQSDSLQAWKVNKKVNSTFFENPNCIKKIVENEINRDENNFSEAQGILFD